MSPVDFEGYEEYPYLQLASSYVYGGDWAVTV